MAKREDLNFNPNIQNAKESEENRRYLEAQKAGEREKLTRWQQFTLFFGDGRFRLAVGVVLIAIGLYLLLSFMSFLFNAGANDQDKAELVIENAQNPDNVSNLGAALGAFVSKSLIEEGVGIAAFIIVIWCITIGARLLRKGKRTHFFSYTLISLFSIFTFSMVIGACTMNSNLLFFPLGGALGHEANKWLLGLIGLYGTFAVNFIILLLWCLLCYHTLKALYDRIPKTIPNFNIGSKDKDIDNPAKVSEFLGDKEQRIHSKHDLAPQPATEVIKPKPRPRQQANSPKEEKSSHIDTSTGKLNPIEQSRQITNPHDPTGEYMHYRFPTLDLMADIKMKTDSVDKEEQDANKQRITETLENFGISIKKIDVHVGPTVTLFEIVPVDGTRVNRIRNLEDDIALSLAAKGIRIIAPMPGRGTIGIEVANREPQVVPMREVLASKAFQESKAKLPMVLGCTVSNEVFVTDLTKMPHLLVAGATGKGKSVGLNAIITSLLYKKGPSEIKFVLVDPKQVEFSIYADLQKYFFALAPGEESGIVTKTDKVVKVLNCLVQEMINRYQILKEVKVRNVIDYNTKWRQELREVRNEHGEKVYQYMPYIVCVIDEFADMIMTAGKAVETPIVRIAQMARAVGIHMIIATQRPSANVITGLIKSNFPGRIAFAVAQMMDSRIIIDRSGAQQLIGRGDMLFCIDGEITRLQCPLVDTPDVENLCNYIKQQSDADKNINHDTPYQLPEYVEESSDDGAGGSADATSSLQRRYEIGYNRAGRIMDQMEAAGIVGPASGGKPRKVLISPLDVDQLFAAP